MAAAFEFNPDAVAFVEAAGWRAYYERKWLKMLRLIMKLCQEQFHIPFPISLLAAYHTIFASVAWVPVDHDERKVLRELEKFYGLARRYSGLIFDPIHVAALEFQYFDVHRRLVGQADKEELIRTLVGLHSALFGLSDEQVREAAELRAKAADLVDMITGKASMDVEGDWSRLEEYLRQCYRSIQRELKS
jgi:hypothetical protein